MAGGDMEDMVDGEVSQTGPAALLGSNGAATGTFTQFEGNELRMSCSPLPCTGGFPLVGMS